MYLPDISSNFHWQRGCHFAALELITEAFADVDLLKRYWMLMINSIAHYIFLEALISKRYFYCLPGLEVGSQTSVAGFSKAC